MRAESRFVASVVFALVAASSHASTVIYNSQSNFAAALTPGAYTNDFTGVQPDDYSYSSGGFGYTVNSSLGMYQSGTLIGSNDLSDPLTITFTTGNVTAVGGDFFATDIDDLFQGVLVMFELSDGTSGTFTPSSEADAFRGFVSTTPIAWLTLSTADGTYNTLDNLTVGQARVASEVAVVPEPSTMLLASLAMGGLLLSRRRQA